MNIMKVKFLIPSKPYRPLHDYQNFAATEILRDIELGISPALRFPTGTGKTFTACEVIRRSLELNQNNRWLVVTPFNEISDAFLAEFDNFGIHDSLVDVTTYQSLRNKIKNLPANLYSGIVVDECHRSRAASIEKALDHFKCSRLGLSATLVRLDGQGLDKYYDKIIDPQTTQWYEDNHFLAPVDIYSRPVADILLTSGDDDLNTQQNLLDKPSITGDVIEHYHELAKGSKTILFASGIDHSNNVVDQFNEYFRKEYGRNLACHLDGKTTITQRKAALEACKTGDLLLLSNVALFIEGLDWPEAVTCIFLRKTMSTVIWNQAIGRIRRYQKDKCGIVLDHVGNVLIHGHPNDPVQYLLEGKTKKKKDYLDPSLMSHCIQPNCNGELYPLLPGISYQCQKCGYLYNKKIQKESLNSRVSPEQVDGQLQKFNRSSKVGSEIYKFIKQFKENKYQSGWMVHKLRELCTKYPQDLTFELCVIALTNAKYPETVAGLITKQLFIQYGLDK